MTFCSVAAADQPPFEVKGIRLGVASAADVTERFQLDALHDPSVYVMPCLTESCFIMPETVVRARCAHLADMACTRNMYDDFRFGPVIPKHYSFKFREGKAALIMVSFEHDQFDALVIALTEKYGKPTSSTAEEVQNKMGAKFARHKVNWERPDGLILLEDRTDSDLTAGSLLMSTKEFLDKETKERVDAAKASASKL